MHAHVQRLAGCPRTDPLEFDPSPYLDDQQLPAIRRWYVFPMVFPSEDDERKAVEDGERSNKARGNANEAEVPMSSSVLTTTVAKRQKQVAKIQNREQVLHRYVDKTEEAKMPETRRRASDNLD